jgi:hypothetical protein
MRVYQVLYFLYIVPNASSEVGGGLFVNPVPFVRGVNSDWGNNLQWPVGSEQDLTWKLEPEYSGELEIYLCWWAPGMGYQEGPQIKCTLLT